MGLRVCVLLLAFGVGFGTLEVTSALSGRRTDPVKAPKVLPGMVLHMHGDQAHYHEIATSDSLDASGLVYKGLKRARRHERCGGGYQLQTSDRPACSHGPDQAPEGVDVRKKPSVAALRAADSSSQAALPCYGDGSSGPRVQAIYAHAAGTADRFGELTALFTQWAARVDSVFNRSAVETGGNRHVRWVTDADCTLSVLNITLSAAGDDSLTSTINELKAQGFTRSDRKYLVWADASRYCGIGEVRNDDSASSSNQNNYGPSFARVDAACWGREASVEAHELMHTMGGIQNSAPHSTGGWHCVDENDRMCLADTPSVALSYSCPSDHENLFDCGHDDYYSTAPVPGSYLAGHWNAANSSFLSADMPESCRITAQGDASTSAKRKHKRRHRRTASAADATSTCIPQNVFS